MRKFAGILFVLIMVVNLSCYAENNTFSIRNNISIGDSMDDVKSKETIEFAEEEENRLKTVSGVIADIQDSWISYSFEEGKLYSITYSFRNDPKGDVPAIMVLSASEYNDIEKALTSKYGPSLENDDVYTSWKTSSYDDFSELHSTMQLVSILSGKKIKSDKLMSERAILLESGMIKIDHFLLQIDDLFFHILSYQYFSDEQIGEVSIEEIDSSVLKDI